ncbi:MAG: hypothetical protein M3Q24_01365 [bacterium]|nr:hypothetical protein [bacterium]
MKKIKYLSKGNKALISYFKVIFFSKRFKRKILMERKIFSIPLEGYPTNKNLFNKNFTYPKSFLKIEQHDQWKASLEYVIENLRREYCLGLEFEDILLKTIFYNISSPDKLLNKNFDLCQIKDFYEYQVRFWTKNIKYIPSIKNAQYNNLRRIEHKKRRDKGSFTKDYPIAILISPYASIGDVRDTIKLQMDKIKKIQLKYRKKGVELGKIKTRFTIERTNLILKNKHLPRKEIAQLVNKKFGQKIDEIYIRNIISKEKKVRKKV